MIFYIFSPAHSLSLFFSLTNKKRERKRVSCSVEIYLFVRHTIRYYVLCCMCDDDDEVYVIAHKNLACESELFSQFSLPFKSLSSLLSKIQKNNIRKGRKMQFNTRLSKKRLVAFIFCNRADMLL